MTCNLYVENFSIPGLHDPSTGICRTLGCQYGFVGNHPRHPPQQPQQGSQSKYSVISVFIYITIYSYYVINKYLNI